MNQLLLDRDLHQFYPHVAVLANTGRLEANILSIRMVRESNKCADMVAEDGGFKMVEKTSSIKKEL